ncbi:hypothetical protein L596_028816 [Steinernema carpocapsae]|uniref:Cyclin-like domain-containing protein n=2 Tax=Steinernema carpocapsae TaxID=34508 RepID=A0A4U5M0I5_STECR|nr:hypothetical protein L596_028816 [Steinernema carpocapsae]
MHTCVQLEPASRRRLKCLLTMEAKIKPSSFGEKRMYSKIDIGPENWLLTMDDESRAKLENPPSLPKIDLETEQDLRFLGCELIQHGATLLRLPQTAAATAQILYQRFYYQRSFARHHFEYSVMACLLLASKIEEAPRRPREVLNVFSYLEHYYRRRHSSQPFKEYPPMAIDTKYVQTKNQVIKMERRILCALGFVVHVKHPHKLIFSYVHVLNCVNNHDLMQKAWSYMNDGLRTDMFLRYKAETIACACIHLAAKTIEPKVPLPEQPFMWFELYDVSERDVEDIAYMLLKMYTRKQTPNWPRLLEIIDKARFGDEPPAPVEVPPKEDPVKSQLALKAEEIMKKAREEAIREGRLAVDGTGELKRKPERVSTVGNGHDRDRDRDRGGRRRNRSTTSRSRSRSPDRKRRKHRSKRSRSESNYRERSRRNGRDHRDKDREHRDSFCARPQAARI